MPLADFGAIFSIIAVHTSTLRETIPRKMAEFGPFWQRKIRTLAVRLDRDEDGKVTKKDFDEICDRYAQLARVSVAKQHQMRAANMTVRS